MTGNDYQKLASRTMSNHGIHINQGLACYGMGLSGEAGEATDYLKKVLFHGHRMDEEVLIEELGDVLWYVAALLTTMNSTMELCMATNIAKLNKRYPSGFNSKDSINRKDQ